MSLIGTQLPAFAVEAFKKFEFVPVTNEDLKGKWSVLFFYPADFTFVCPTELEDLADNYEDFKKIGCEIYSVSTDTHFTHKAWHDTSDAIKKVEFPMLGDPTGNLSRAFGVYQEASGLDQRGTFVIDPKGRIVACEIHDEGIGRDAKELLRKVQAAQFIEANPGMVCPAKWKPGQKTLAPSIDLVGKI